MDEGALFLARLRKTGLRGIDRCTLTRNRATLVSFRGADLRAHRAFVEAPEEILRAIVTFVNGRGTARRAAKRAILSHPIAHEQTRSRRREHGHPDDAMLSMRLREEHERLNAQRFGGALRPVTLRVSRRMRTRLGHYAPALNHGQFAEIAISRRHVARHPWAEVVDTLLHEMVHQWQDEQRLPLGHGADFRRKAREVGALARASRSVGMPRAYPD
jgi:hypothetical protein